jgi:hypothetical protein
MIICDSELDGHDLADHLADIAAPEVTKNFSRLRCDNLPERLKKTNFVLIGLPVGCRRQKLESCGGQILLSGRPSFNFQQLLGRFHLFIMNAKGVYIVPISDRNVFFRFLTLLSVFVVGCGKTEKQAKVVNEAKENKPIETAFERSDSQIALKKSDWKIEATDIGAIASSSGVGICNAWTLSRHGNRYAYAIVEKVSRAKPKHMGMSGLDRDGNEVAYQWFVDGQKVDFNLPENCLDFLWQGQFDFMTGPGYVFQENAGRLFFSDNESEWLLVLPCRLEALFEGPGGRHDKRFENVLLFVVNGDLRGIARDLGSLSDIEIKSGIFDSINQKACFVVSSNSDFGRNQSKTSTIFLACELSSSYFDDLRYTIKSLAANNIRASLSKDSCTTKVAPQNNRAFCSQIINDSLRWLVLEENGKLISDKGLVECSANVSNVAKLSVAGKDGSIILEGYEDNFSRRLEFTSLIFNGLPQKQFEKILGFNNSPDGKHYAAIVTEFGKIYSLVDNNAVELQIGDSFDGCDVQVDNNGFWRALCGRHYLENGKLIQSYTSTSRATRPTSDSNFTFIAIKAVSSAMEFVGGAVEPVVVENGSEKAVRRKIRLMDTYMHGLGNEAVVSKNRMAIASWNGPNSTKKTFVLLNGSIVGDDEYILHPRLAPILSEDGSDVVFVARSAGEWKLHVNGFEVLGFDDFGLGDSSLVFNNAGDIVFFAEKSGRAYQVLLSKLEAENQD